MARKKTTVSPLRIIQAGLPGPWRYLDLLPTISLLRNLLADLPRGAYPILALMAWRTLTAERKKQQHAVLYAHREAIRRSQPVFVVGRKRKRFGVF